MDINELEAFKMSDAVKFHNKLNPNLWIGTELDPVVREQLLLIAEDFVTTLGIKDLDIVDITISGSNAAYSYTPHSDLDLHVLVDMSKLRDDEIYRELFTAKKTLYNDSHDITVHGVPVELYVQDVNEPVKSLGEYSVLNDKWIRIPKKTKANFDQAATKAKFDNLAEIVELALKTKNLDRVEKTIDTIKRYRKAGLSKGGEFGPENLAFKALRKQGGIQDLYDLRDVLRSEKLSIEEYANEDYDPNGPPPGPEFKPTMPAGTVRVDVSDVYDWYKLGQHISNMKGLGKHDFGKGPPSTVLSFGDEDTEHEYIQDLEKTGLTTTDIDPVDPNQPKGMKRQKTDPTFNVNETDDRTAAVLKIQKYLNKKYGANLDLDGKLGPLTLKSINKFMPRAKKGLADEPNKTTAVQGKKVKVDETAEENQIVNMVSNIAAAQIAKVMKSKESKLLALLDGGLRPKEKLELFGVKVKDLNVPNVNDPLLKKLFNILYIKVNSQLDFYDDPSAPKTLGGYYDGDYTVELFFPAIEYVAGKRESQLKSEIASTLAHEIQHAIDDYKSDNKVYAGSNISPAKDLQGYLKLPYEVNARFQEATMDIAKYITMPKNDGSKTTQADLPELIRYAFEKNRLDKIYEKNQKEYKRLLTRAYKFFQAELNSPKKATPIPQNVAKRALAWILGKQTKEINEASGYIPSEKEKNDPRFLMALTKDVRPDANKKNAKAFGWKVSRAGIPPQARADGKIAESLMNQWKSFLMEGSSPKIGYHVTATEKLPIILKHGIKADRRGNSYVWDSLEMAQWFKDFQNDEDQDRTIVKVDMSDLDAHPDPETDDMSEWSSRFEPGTKGGAWIVSGPIPSDKIIG